jgi:hypothetical protein
MQTNENVTMGETLLGGVASIYLGRLANDALRDQFTTRGYGLYFTESRIIGVSYKRITSRALLPGYVAFLVFVVSLTSGIVYSNLTGTPSDQPIPYAFIFYPLIFGGAVLSLLYMLYLGPRQATKRIERQQVNSIMELVSQPNNLVLERNNISQVTVQYRMIYVLTKSGQWYYFGFGTWGSGLGYSRKRVQLLLDLFQKFCSQSPPIGMFIR